mmetsp:Transcript_96798/g.172204  ORF Transcript_96798/g.172204 Transcript_96798/m.172204 type:complete len:503 (-) Transcript_96798:183-1691(-)
MPETKRYCPVFQDDIQNTACVVDEGCRCANSSHARELVNVTLDGKGCYACEPRRPAACTEASDQCTPEFCECANPYTHAKHSASTIDGSPCHYCETIGGNSVLARLDVMITILVVMALLIWQVFFRKLPPPSARSGSLRLSRRQGDRSRAIRIRQEPATWYEEILMTLGSTFDLLVDGACELLGMMWSIICGGFSLVGDAVALGFDLIMWLLESVADAASSIRSAVSQIFLRPQPPKQKAPATAKAKSVASPVKAAPKASTLRNRGDGATVTAKTSSMNARSNKPEVKPAGPAAAAATPAATSAKTKVASCSVPASVEASGEPKAAGSKKAKSKQVDTVPLETLKPEVSKEDEVQGRVAKKLVEASPLKEADAGARKPGNPHEPSPPVSSGLQSSTSLGQDSDEQSTNGDRADDDTVTSVSGDREDDLVPGEAVRHPQTAETAAEAAAILAAAADRRAAALKLLDAVELPIEVNTFLAEADLQAPSTALRRTQSEGDVALYA